MSPAAATARTEVPIQAELYWIADPALGPGRLATAPRPRGGDWLKDEIASFQRQGVDVVVSALTAAEERELDLEGERSACAAAGLHFVSLPIADRGVPADRVAFVTRMEELAALVRDGRAVLVHCRQGIGRASILVAGVLAALGLAMGDAFDRIAAARGRPVPDTPEQRAWLVAALAGRTHR